MGEQSAADIQWHRELASISQWHASMSRILYSGYEHFEVYRFNLSRRRAITLSFAKISAGLFLVWKVIITYLITLLFDHKMDHMAAQLICRYAIVIQWVWQMMMLSFDKCRHNIIAVIDDACRVIYTVFGRWSVLISADYINSLNMLMIYIIVAIWASMIMLFADYAWALLMNIFTRYYR